MTRSRKLSRQMARYLGSDSADESLLHLLEFLRSASIQGLPADGMDALGRLPAFLDIVDESYQQYEDSLAISERNISISSEELVRANRSIQSMVNSLGQGFLTFDATGICSPVYSKACETLFEIIPAGKHISAVLRMDDNQKKTMESLLRLAFSDRHAMTFEEIMRFAPKFFRPSSGARVHIAYKADMDGERIDRIVAVATDITEQVRAREIVVQKKALFDSIERIFQDRGSFSTYLRRLQELLGALDEHGDHLTWEALQREAHTLKGGAGIFRLNAISGKLHDLESALRPLVAAMPQAMPQSGDPVFLLLREHRKHIQSEVDAFSDQLKGMFGVDVTKIDDVDASAKKNLYAFADYLRVQGNENLRQEYIRRICAEPVSGHLRRYNFVLGDLASRLNKKVHPIKFTGAEISIVVDSYRGLFDSFVHIFRNTADHGIEPPDTRRQRGKDQFGLIEIHTELCDVPGGKKRLRMEIMDDGDGIDIERLRIKFMSRFPTERWDVRPECEIFERLLVDNVSSCDEASVYSGRGVGLSAVNAEVLKLGGAMSLSSVLHKGTRVTIEVPYVLDIVNS